MANQYPSQTNRFWHTNCESCGAIYDTFLDSKDAGSKRKTYRHVFYSIGYQICIKLDDFSSFFSKKVYQPDKPVSQPDKPVSQPDKPVSHPWQTRYPIHGKPLYFGVSHPWLTSSGFSMLFK